MVKSMKKMLRQTFSVFEPDNVWKWEIISTVSDRNFIIFWQMELVFCFFLLFFLVHPVYSKFWLCDYC